MDNIQKTCGINIKDNDCTFFEHQLIPPELKFYNRIFTIQIQKPNQIKKKLKSNTNYPNYKGNIKIINNNNLNNPNNAKNQFLSPNAINNYFIIIFFYIYY